MPFGPKYPEAEIVTTPGLLTAMVLSASAFVAMIVQRLRFSRNL